MIQYSIPNIRLDRNVIGMLICTSIHERLDEREDPFTSHQENCIGDLEIWTTPATSPNIAVPTIIFSIMPKFHCLSLYHYHHCCRKEDEKEGRGETRGGREWRRREGEREGLETREKRSPWLWMPPRLPYPPLPLTIYLQYHHHDYHSPQPITGLHTHYIPHHH